MKTGVKLKNSDVLLVARFVIAVLMVIPTELIVITFFARIVAIRWKVKKMELPLEEIQTAKKRNKYVSNTAEDIVGRKYGMLTVISRAENMKNHVFWNCKCECGKETKVESYNLKHGKTKSCGCYKSMIAAEMLRKRGFADKRLRRIHRIHYNIKQRCLNPLCKDYKHYGERGIHICQEWMDVNIFTKWALENGYRDDLSIDRIDYDKNYEPSNCRWATIKIQANNKRNNRIIIYKGERYTLTCLAEKYHIKPNALRMRLSYGWSLDEALNISPTKTKSRTKRKEWKKCQH